MRDRPQLEAVEAAVGQHQHVRAQPLRQRPGRHRLLAVRVRRHLGRGDDMRAALDQAEQPRLREGAVAARGGRIAEELGVGLLIGHVHATAVQRHQAPAPIPAARRFGRCQRPQDALRQPPHHLGAEPAARLRDRRLARLHRLGRPAAEPVQTFANHPQHFFQRRLAPQRQRHHVVHDRRRRQQPVAMTASPGFFEHLVDQRPRAHAGQHAGADQVRNIDLRRQRLAGPGHRRVSVVVTGTHCARESSI